MKKEFYTAGELAKLTGVSYKTIRHYQQKGLLELVLCQEKVQVKCVLFAFAGMN